MPRDVAAVLGADTLLSEKFIGLSAGTAGGPLLADGAVIQGLAQPTFDDLVRGGADMFAEINQFMPEVKARMNDLLPKLASISDAGHQVAGDVKAVFAKATALMDNLIELSNSGKEVVGDAKSLIGNVNEAAGDARELIGTTNKLIQDNRDELEKTLTELPQVLDHLDTLLGRTQGLLTSNEKELGATIRDLHTVMQDMRVVAVHAKKITANLAGGRPTKLIWTRDDEPPPSDAEILRGGEQPAPATPKSTLKTPGIGAGKR
jgi:ABC-type transporter Mla subunit MlaD